MRHLHWLLSLSILACASTAAAAQTPPPSNEVPAPTTPTGEAPDPRAEALKRIRALPWRDVHEMKLPRSKATLQDLPGFAGLTGADAQTSRAIIDGNTDPTIEGDVIRRSASSEVLLSWREEGYVDAKDFSDIDPDKLIDSVREATFANNEASTRAGQRPMTAVKWLRKRRASTTKVGTR